MKLKPNLFIVGIVSLILLHGFLDSFFKIDNVTIILIILILVSPYFPLIKKIKFGDFEAEITQKEINDVKEKIDNLEIDGNEDSQKYSELEKIAQTDLILFLAKIRIEIEKKLKSLLSVYTKSLPERFMKRISLRGMIHELSVKKIIEKDFEEALVEITDIANRAIHGEETSTENKEVLIATSVDILRKLDFLASSYALKLMKKQIINEKTYDQYENSVYQLTTVVPYVNHPEKRVYKLDQAELTAFLNNYEEHAEFIIELKKI